MNNSSDRARSVEARRIVWGLAALAALAAACSAPDSDALVRRGQDPGATGATEPDAGAEAPPAPACPGAGKPWVGIGGIDLRADRVDAPAGLDRGRVKPFGALTGELTRVLGATPASMPELASALGTVPARWYVEDEGSAMAVYAAHRVAFEGCLTMTATPPLYAAAPTTESATTECARLTARAWSRKPDQAQLDACVKLAVTESASEPDPRRRWASVCAAVLSSSGFLTY